MILLAYFLDYFCISAAACRTLELRWVMANCTNFPCGRHCCRWYISGFNIASLICRRIERHCIN